MRKKIKLELRDRIFELKGTNCFYCQVDLLSLPSVNRTLDHILEVYMGGENNEDNLLPCCRSCNSERTGKTVDEMLFYVQNKEEYRLLKWRGRRQGLSAYEVLTTLISNPKKV